LDINCDIDFPGFAFKLAIFYTQEPDIINTA